jgi:hypothetical protein
MIEFMNYISAINVGDIGFYVMSPIWATPSLGPSGFLLHQDRSHCQTRTKQTPWRETLAVKESANPPVSF